MGVLTDIVVADRHEAERVCASNCPSRDFGGIDAKGIDTVKLGQLHALLNGQDFDPSFMSEIVCSGGKDGPWVFEVPADLVATLSNLDASQLTSAGKRWAAIEEFSPKYDNWPVADVLQMLQELVTLSKRAIIAQVGTHVDVLVSPPNKALQLTRPVQRALTFRFQNVHHTVKRHTAFADSSVK